MNLGLIDLHNITEELARTYKGLPGSPISNPPLGIVVCHEGGLERDGSSVYGVARIAVEDDRLPNIGYTWAIERNGALYQCLSLDVGSGHLGLVEGDDLAKFPNKDPEFYNDHYWSVVLIGNLEAKPASDPQVETLFNLCGALKRALPLGFKVFGHGELPGKATLCPGRHLHMSYVRQEAEKRVVTGPSKPNAIGPGPGDEEWARATGMTKWRDVATAVHDVNVLWGGGIRDTIKMLENEIATGEERLRNMRTTRDGLKSMMRGK